MAIIPLMFFIICLFVAYFLVNLVFAAAWILFKACVIFVVAALIFVFVWGTFWGRHAT